ncbi:TOR2 phosphatidylinositol 3 and 4-kinase [Polychaeton citri CBS 116435]|uniref:Serine/threonine-protein kinase Tel1 n=1 Tax=Polychaeton citri CBS 116435 TaxID=1314669 RepID=A0A9P4Q391_9PEZI|nr:TOR2 phosphatidylinositol 3 and 4-kinase [Polychaeton citri CBS 116435]
MAETTLNIVLGRINDAGLKLRSEGLEQLKNLLRHEQRSPKTATLRDASFKLIYEVLFGVVVSEQSAYVRSKSSTKSTRSAAEGRLSNCSQTLRLAVDVGVRSIKLRTVQSLLDHIEERLHLPDGELCKPIAHDYAKSLHTVLSYQPHVERLPATEWERVANFCLTCLDAARLIDADDGLDATAENPTTASRLSYRSSFVKDSMGQEDEATLHIHLAEEAVSALTLLTNAPNAPLKGQASPLLWAVIDFIKFASSTGRSHDHAHNVINNVLSRICTEDIALMRKATIPLTRLIRNSWPTKSSTLKDQLLMIFLHLQPFIVDALNRGQITVLRPELLGLLETLTNDCSKRPERDQLRQEDLRFDYFDDRSRPSTLIHNQVFALRCVGTPAEQAWTIVETMAFLCDVTAEQSSAGSLSSGDDIDSGRPLKRLRRSDDLEEVIVSTTNPISMRISSLQTLAFLSSRKALKVRHIGRMIDALLSCIADESSAVSSWAYLALTSLATNNAASSRELASRWASVWQYASRAICNIATCQTGSHLTHTLIHLRLVDASAISELVQAISTSMEVNGPAVLVDSAIQLLTTVNQAARLISPGSSTTISESILGWLFRLWVPANFPDRSHQTLTTRYQIVDVLNLVNGCMNHPPFPTSCFSAPTWERVAQTWLACSNRRPLLSYLLLQKESKACTRISELAVSVRASRPLSFQQHLPCETTTLTYFTSEIQRMLDVWTVLRREREKQISTDAFRHLCTALTITTCIAYGRSLRDHRKQSHLQGCVRRVWDAIVDFAGLPTCELEKVDVMLASCSQVFDADYKSSSTMESRPTYEDVLCGVVTRVAIARRRASDSLSVEGDFDDGMDFDLNHDSQQSRDGSHDNQTNDFIDELAASYSKVSFRSRAIMYSYIHKAIQLGPSDTSDDPGGSAAIIDFALALPTSELLSACKVLSTAEDKGLHLLPSDVERFLENMMDPMVNSYHYGRCERVLGAIVDVLTAWSSIWTDKNHKSLYELGLDTYSWFLEVAFKAGVLSPTVQERVANLLLQLARIDTEYGRAGDAPSVRTSLFRLVKQGNIAVKFQLAEKISSIFGLYVLSTHTAMFDDLQDSLPADSDWIEGIALRLLFLSKLAAAWHSLLRQCMYYLFETAGRVKKSMRYATHCIASIAGSLNFESAEKLFTLFAPQMLHTWLSDHSLSDLPYAAFNYQTLEQLLILNEAEVAAQLFMRGNAEELAILTKAVGADMYIVLSRSFGKSAAYALSWDIGELPADLDKTLREKQLQAVIGSKEEWKTMLSNHFPAIVGQFLLSMQLNDGVEKTFEKHKSFARAANIIAEMRSYSHSDAVLPAGQQPSFKGRLLIEQIERLCRRTGLDPGSLWNVSSFTLTARMLFDALDESLGALSFCYIIRKIRLLIALSGKVATTAYPLRMLIHTLRPYLIDSQCADDTIGILKYLYKHGEVYLADYPVFYFGTAMLALMQLRQHMRTRQDSTTQGTQHKATIEKMHGFYKWLVNHIQQSLKGMKEAEKAQYAELVTALSQMQMPGNSFVGTPESTILLILIKQWNATDGWLSREDCSEALDMMARDFYVPPSVDEDCLGPDAMAVEFSQGLWNIMREQQLDQSFSQWAAKAIGRSYAASGKQPIKEVSERTAKMTDTITPQEAVHESHVQITRRIVSRLQSRRKQTASVAEYTLRSIAKAYHSQNEEEAVAFEQTLSESVASAVHGGPYGYQPIVSIFKTRMSPFRSISVQSTLAVSTDSPLSDWAARIALELCQTLQEHPILGCLPAKLTNTPEFALEVLPATIHILLFHEISHGGTLREELSESINAHFADRRSELRPKQRFFLEVLLYLRSCPFPSGATKSDSLRWLEIDYSTAAAIADCCKMHTAALMLAESSVPVATISRRSSRASVSQTARVQVSDDLLLSIFRNVDEPDSFYGVKQIASLDSVLERLDFEADGTKSLVFRSAQLDTQMIQRHAASRADATGLLRSLTTMNLSSVTLALLSAGTVNITNNNIMFDTARRLQQWNVAAPDDSTGSAMLFSVLQDLNHSTNLKRTLEVLDTKMLQQLKTQTSHGTYEKPLPSFMQTLASLTEISDLLTSKGTSNIQKQYDAMESRQDWMRLSTFEEYNTCLSSRETLLGVLGDNKAVLDQLRSNARDFKVMQSRSLLTSSTVSRLHCKIQNALSAATQMSDLSEQCSSLGLNTEAASKLAVASVLADIGEVEASVNMMKMVVSMCDLEDQAIPVGRSGLLAQLGRRIEDSRLEKPEQIMENYLKPAITHLNGHDAGREASNVFFEFASFCDRQLQNPGNLEDFNRLGRMRQQKQEEVEAFENVLKSTKKSAERDKMGRSYRQAKTWLQIDSQEFKRQKESRDTWTQQSLHNYLLALQASNEHDICVLRFFALWLENDDSNMANDTVASQLDAVPSWKFVVLLNQLMSRLKAEQTQFQMPLMALAERICSEHPYHSLHHLFASTRSPKPGDEAGRLRHAAASDIRRRIHSDQKKGPLLKRVFDSDRQYNNLAWAEFEGRKSSKIALRDLPQAYQTAKLVPDRKVPPATIHLELRPDGDYDDVPVVIKFESSVSIMTGLSAPKLLTAIASDGLPYKQLFKSGNDDLRQDTIMEQVFEEVSKMLRNHTETRQRNLHVRTYKVIPLESQSGIIEFVRNSIPINDVLQGLHSKYHPQDWKQQTCREKIGAVSGQSTEARVKEFRKICEHVHPVLRHFFFERYNEPDEWFEKRTAYTRTTASVSILGYVLGLGDRHCHNILLDEKSGEVVHIDLGVAFEGGRVLPIPELVPFRLTRDIVDGMGITKTEGIFRRCCEFTMDALRGDKDSIMTLLNVLRYDPLQTWGLSPLRAKRMQDAQINTSAITGAAGTGVSGRKKDNEAAEADRALTIVEKKLSKTLSTAATVNELIQQATDERNLATLFMGWAAFY